MENVGNVRKCGKIVGKCGKLWENVEKWENVGTLIEKL